MKPFLGLKGGEEGYYREKATRHNERRERKFISTLTSSLRQIRYYYWSASRAASSINLSAIMRNPAIDNGKANLRNVPLLREQNRSCRVSQCPQPSQSHPEVVC